MAVRSHTLDSGPRWEANLVYQVPKLGTRTHVPNAWGESPRSGYPRRP